MDLRDPPTREKRGAVWPPRLKRGATTGWRGGAAATGWRDAAVTIQCVEFGRREKERTTSCRRIVPMEMDGGRKGNMIIKHLLARGSKHL